MLTMTSKDHRERISIMHEKNSIMLSKVTHAARPYVAKAAREHGAGEYGTKALGGWSDNGSFRPCYDRAFPLDALLGAAHFNGRKPEGYFLARSTLGESRGSHAGPRHSPPSGSTVVPAELTAQVFPWVEMERAALEKRTSANRNALDLALKEFLKLMQWLRLVLIQDAAVLLLLVPSAAIFHYPPFNSCTFANFSASSISAVAAAEETARLALDKLPHQISSSLGGLLQMLAATHEQDRLSNQATQQRMVQQFELLHRSLSPAPHSRTRPRRSKACEAVPPIISLPLPDQSRLQCP
jgi:hypothetical protein